MREIRLSDTYMDSFDNLPKQQRRIVKNSIKQFAMSDKGNNFKVHKLEKEACDPSFRSARINDNLRLIFSVQGEKYIFLYVDNHDDAYSWARNKFLHKDNFNSTFLYDRSIEIKYNDEYQQSPIHTAFKPKGVLEEYGIKGKELEKLGLPPHFANILLEITCEDQFLQLIEMLPKEIQENLLDLFTGEKNITQAYADLETLNKDSGNELESSRFYKVEDEADFDRVLDENFERWKLFLHPKQSKLVTKNFNGPVLVEGGPGTGKTIVGLHRAVHLAKNVYPSTQGGKILICTFSKKLVAYIEDKLRPLMRINGVKEGIFVQGIDSLIFEQLQTYGLSIPVNQPRYEELFKEVYTELKPSQSLLFCYTELVEIIARYNIRTVKEYLRVNRIGIGEALNPAARQKLWTLFSRFREEQERLGIYSFDDRVWTLLEAINEGRVPSQYDSIIIDEAQDLTPAKIRVLNELTRQRTNNFMILSDQNQRIYNFYNWCKDVKVDVVGRSYHLNLNYRTSKQIKEHADKQFIRSKMLKDHLKGYKSLFGGPEPQIEIMDDAEEQYDWVVEKIKQWVEAGISPYEIGVFTLKNVDTVSRELVVRGLENKVLRADSYPNIVEDKLGVSSLHGCKGLEFRAVIIVDHQDIYPQVEPENEIAKWYLEQKTREIECLKYVACTRARE